MSVLKGLTFAAIPKSNFTPEQYRRNKLVAHLTEQLEIAKAEAEGRSYSVSKRKWQKTAEGGKQLVEANKRLKQWWQVEAAGNVLLTVRYGAKPLEFDKGKAAIQLKSKAELLTVIPKLIAAAQAGEFDALMAAASKQRQIPKRKVA